MIRALGTVIAVQSDSLWVETVSQSTCGACVARQGCGQRLLSRLSGRSNRILVPWDSGVGRSIGVGDEVAIGIPEEILVKGSILVYLLPLLGLVAGATIGQVLWQSDWAAILLGLVGLGCGGLLVRVHARMTWKDPRFCPVVLDR